MSYTYICIPSPKIPIESNIERNRKKLDQIKMMITKGKNRLDVDDIKSPISVLVVPKISGRFNSSYYNRFSDNI